MSDLEPDRGSHSSVLVARLRELGRAVHAAEADPAARSAALEHLEAARDLLSDGTPRRRWYEVDGGEASATRARNRELSTFSGELNPIAPPMQIGPGELADGTAALIGNVRLDSLREGPPRAVHGGIIAGLFDELMGAGQRLGGGPPGMTARLTVRYRRPTPLDADLELRAWIHDERTKRVVVKAECVVVGGDSATDERELVTAEAEAVFLRVDFSQLEGALRARSEGEPTDPGRAPGLQE